MSDWDVDENLKLVREKITEARKFIPAARMNVEGNYTVRSGVDLSLECLADALDTLAYIIDHNTDRK